MNAYDRAVPEAAARIDADGRLVRADARLAALNGAAGGAIGAPLALAPIAGIARLARRLGIVIARQAIVADGDDDLALWVRAEPDDEGVSVQVSGWEPCDAQGTPTSLHGASDFDAADSDFTWETDAAMCLTALSGESAGIDGAALLGQPITRFLSLDEAADGLLPILTAAANRDGFTDQPATIRATGRRLRIAASARRDAAGRFAGFYGSARFVELAGGQAARADAEGDDDPAFPDAFSERLDRALRLPLVRIVAHADSIGAQTDGPVKAQYVEYAQDIASAARHLMGLVDDLVDLQAIERADFVAEREPIDLADVARRAAGLLGVRAGQARVRIERPDMTATLPAVGEFRRVLQILVNLIGNALRYSPEDGIVSLRLERVGAVAHVVIGDQGKGIAAADQQHIFEKFGRVDPAEPGGTGLGLYIARRLARAMGGDLTVESAVGQGARFTLSLPARD